MSNEEILSTILTADLSKEQKDALLAEYANKLIKENKEKTWEEKHEETIEKSRKQSQAVKERLKEYEEKSLKEEKQRLFEKELERKIKILEQIENKNGEKIYSDLKDASVFEIESIYALYEKNNPELLKEIEENLKNGKIKETLSENKKDSKVEETLSENNKDSKVAETTDIESKQTEDINNQTKSEESKEVGSSTEEQENKDENNKKIVEPENPKKVKSKSIGAQTIMNLVDSKAGKAVMAAAGFIAFIALFMSNPALATTAILGMGGWAGHEYYKGRKL